MKKKTAIVIAHYGTTDRVLKAVVTDRLREILEDRFKDIDIYQLYTAKIVREIWKREGVEFETTCELMGKLIDLGYEKIIVQPTYLISGNEMESLKNSLTSYLSKANIVIGNPLLSTIEDCFELIKIVDLETGEKSEDEGIALIGHGSKHSPISVYPTLDYIAKDLGLNIFVGVIMGYPNFETVSKMMKKVGIKRVKLIPLLFLGGQHIKNDIEMRWKNYLIDEGFEVTVEKVGLGERKSIQESIIQKINCYLEVD